MWPNFKKSYLRILVLHVERPGVFNRISVVPESHALMLPVIWVVSHDAPRARSAIHAVASKMATKA